MSPDKDRPLPANRTRRHFLGLTAVTGAKIAAAASVTMAALSTPSRASGILWGRGRRGGNNGGGGENGGGESGGGSNGGGGSGSDAGCFLRGTCIATPEGEVRIEDLRIGDLVKTAHGKTVAIKWIGRQHYRKTGSAWQDGVMPVRVSRNALGQQAPHADLYLSANHALYLDGVLIRVKELVNGSSIAQALPEETGEIEYFNILLDTHQVILAEGVPAETFLVRGANHETFANFAEYERLYPAEARSTMEPFAPVVGYEGGHAHLKALLRLATPRLMRQRDPIEEAYGKIAARAVELAI
ncbi:Hint domain-containing protein [Rhizobium sp. BK251]|uniref:Hint domain-containing protein n=1 Tax=Rhizobium sp. BK251 TaxID=2512125 RepID=UPI00104B5EDB|nr:Hint domain-containing protein [Rhizobium sp. BK251]TCL74515.1 Hint domain-containing protein [Rhizobium sp. BK251]